MKTYLMTFCAAGLLCILAACARVPDSIDENAFEATFGMRPPQGVADVRGGYVDNWEDGWCYLKFTCSSNIFISLIHSNCVPVTRADFSQALTPSADDHSYRPSQPSWWTPLADADTFFLTHSNSYANPFKHFSKGLMLASFDTNHNVSYIYWEAM